MIFAVGLSLGLAGCGAKSLSDTLTAGSGQWSAVTSEGDQLEVTFFENGNATLGEVGESGEKGKYEVQDDTINLVDDNGKVMTAFKKCKIDGDSIKATLSNVNIDEEQSITFTKK